MDEIIELIDKYWRFDDNQQPMSSWHEKQDLIELLRSKQTGTNTLVSGSAPPINIYDLNQVKKHFGRKKHCR
jgi:hypothetical protein